MLRVNSIIYLLLALIQICPDHSFLYWNDYSEKEQQTILSLPTVDKDAVGYYVGTLPVSDDERSFSLLDELTGTVRDMRIKAFYLYVFNQILQKSDGALAEVMGQYCGGMVLSSPRFVLNFLAKEPTINQLYIFHIAAELSISVNLGRFTRNGRSFEWFCEQVKSSFSPGDAIPKDFLMAIEKKRIELSD